MESTILVLLIGSGVGFVALIIAIAMISAKKRREAWAREAERLGFQYERDSFGLANSYGDFKVFSRGRSRRTANAIYGELDGSEVCLADYQYTTGSGKNSRTHSQTVCIIKDPRMFAPHCFVRREVRMFDFLGKVFGGKDINYDEDPAFSKAFVLQGESEPDTRTFFHGEVRRHFMQFAKTNINFEIRGDTLAFHRGARMKPEQVRELLDDALGLFRLFCRPTDPLGSLKPAGGGLDEWEFSG